jgi:hypothetical protein
VEGEDGEPRDTPEERDTPGVRWRLYRAVAGVLSGLASRLWTHFGGTGDPGGGDCGRQRTTENPTAIRTSGQARLESGPEESRGDEDRPELPVVAGEQQSVEATVQGDTLRIHRPDSVEAYIESDVYERVER